MTKSGLKGHTSLRGREAGSGRFVPVEQARQRPSTTVVTRVPKAGYGAESSTTVVRDARSGQFAPPSDANRRPASTVTERVTLPRKR